MVEKKVRRNKNFDKYCVTNKHYCAPYLVKISPKHANHLIDDAPAFSGLFTKNFSISQTIWESIKNKVNETMPGLFNNEGKAMVINDKGEINDKFFLYCVWHGIEDNYPWTNLPYLDPDAPGFQTIPGYKPMKKWFEKSQHKCYINFIPKVLDDIIRKYWMDQMKDIKTIPQLIEFLKQQKDNSIPNYNRVYFDRPANENDLTDPNVSPDDETIFKKYTVKNYILSDKINEILKSYPNYEFTEDEVLTIAEKTNATEFEILTLVKNEQFKSKFEEINKLANKS